jgi:ABC-2 type transport system permease protein
MPASEWTKLRTVRSTAWTLGMTALVGLAASGIATGVTRAHWATLSAGSRASFHPVEVSLTGVSLGGTLLLASSASWS